MKKFKNWARPNTYKCFSGSYIPTNVFMGKFYNIPRLGLKQSKYIQMFLWGLSTYKCFYGLVLLFLVLYYDLIYFINKSIFFIENLFF